MYADATKKFDKHDLITRYKSHAYTFHLGDKKIRKMVDIIFSVLEKHTKLTDLFEFAVMCGFIAENGKKFRWINPNLVHTNFILKRIPPLGTRTTEHFINFIINAGFDFDVGVQLFPKKFIVFSIWKLTTKD